MRAFRNTSILMNCSFRKVYFIEDFNFRAFKRIYFTEIRRIIRWCNRPLAFKYEEIIEVKKMRYKGVL